MAPVKRAASSASQAEVVLLPQLKSCLLNLPSSLVAVLLNANTIAQNVVVELSYRQPTAPGTDSKPSAASKQQSVYLGWTGMPSKSKLAPLVGKDGLRTGRTGGGRQDQSVDTVEIDTTFARVLGIVEGQKVGVTLHIDPPQVHTVHIEPLTPTDWEIIELHSRFLEMNFLSQIRALPHPHVSKQHHPLTLHLTPTSTANVLVTSLEPSATQAQQFFKISPDAEVIVAPKVRESSSRDSRRESRSVASTSRKSMGGWSAASNTRHRSVRDESTVRRPVFLRGVDRSLANGWFDEVDSESADLGLRIWVDPELLLTKGLKGVTWAATSLVRPANLQEVIDPQAQAMESERPATKVVARLVPWEDAPDKRHAALSSMLCATLGLVGFVGLVIKVEAAPAQVAKTTSVLKQTTPKEVAVKNLRIFPFTMSGTLGSSAIKFGGESEAEKAAAVQRVRALFGGDEEAPGLLEGPLTDGMVLPAEAGKDDATAWPGGVLRFDPISLSPESAKKPVTWLLGAERKLGMTVQAPISRPPEIAYSGPGEGLPHIEPSLVGIDLVISQLRSYLSHSSSVLLTGSLGSGKTSLTQLVAHRLRSEQLYHVIYFSCRTLMTDETRVSTIKEALHRVFGSASWGARLGGKSLVILDDLDKLCPVETELQIGGENGRSRQVSELVCSVVRQYASRDSGVVLLATAQGKESLNAVVVGGHILRDVVSLKAPNKDGRRQVLKQLIEQKGKGSFGNDRNTSDGSAWMDESGKDDTTTDGGDEGFLLDPSIDLLDIAGQTDGYMPGDLTLLVSRAHSEALVRSVSAPHGFGDGTDSGIILSNRDFAAALKGFTPASLRNVTLQSSTTTFSSIGGLRETRQTLLETLQYPTTYAPIFAHCPLRLRSGLLLYGYPGCGKTLLASAVAGECGLNFISVKGPEILNKYIGASEKSVRDLFERAEAARPCVLFFDEFDSIAPKRGHDSTGVTDRVVNQLLTQMDGAEGLSGVYVLAATSRPDLIDPALLRPGRLDKSLLCDMPSLDDRLDILKAVSSKLRLENSLLHAEGEGSLQEVARQTEGYSGADLQAVMYNAHLEAIHNILGPTDVLDGGMEKTKKSSATGGAGHRDFTFFRLGDESSVPPEGAGNLSQTTYAALAERASIASKLSAIEVARRRAKQQRSQEHNQRDPARDAPTEDTDDRQQEPVIGWQHIRKSLSTTRPSISRQEQRRLQGIYKEFVVGRNGEMPNGQAGNEIGARTSLM